MLKEVRGFFGAIEVLESADLELKIFVGGFSCFFELFNEVEGLIHPCCREDFSIQADGPDVFWGDLISLLGILQGVHRLSALQHQASLLDEAVSFPVVVVVFERFRVVPGGSDDADGGDNHQ